MTNPNQLSAPIANRRLAAQAAEELKNFRETGDCRVATGSLAVRSVVTSAAATALAQPAEVLAGDAFQQTF